MGNELAKIEGFRSELAIVETIEEIRLIADAAKAYAELMRRQKVGKDKQNELGLFILEVDEKEAEWLNEYYRHGVRADRRVTQVGNSKMPVNPKESARVRRLKRTEPEIKQKVIQNIIDNGDVITSAKVDTEIKKANKRETLAKKKEEYLADSVRQIEQKPIIHLSNAIEYLNGFADSSIDLLITDPPYYTDVDDIFTFTQSWLPLAIQKTKQNGRIYICSGAYPAEILAFLNILYYQDKFIVDCPLIWTYRNTLGVTPKMKYNLNYQLIWHLYSDFSNPLDTSITNEIFSVQNINAPDGRLGNRLHIWQKPDELALRLIRHSTQENDLVVDPFTCTGTFLIAAAMLKRNAVGCDNNEDNLKIAKSRGCNIIRGK